MSLKAKLKQRKPEHVDLVFCMDRPLAKALEDARAEERRLSGGSGDYGPKKGKPGHADAVARVRELEKQAADASVTIRVSSLDWQAYNELMQEHPAREGKDEQFNSSTFFEAAAKATAVEVTAKSTVPIPDEDWDEFVSGLTDGEYDRLAGAVVQVNRNLATVNVAPLG